MSDSFKRGRGRPTKEQAEAYRLAKEAEERQKAEDGLTPDEISVQILNEALSRPRKFGPDPILQADHKTLTLVFELAKLACTQAEAAGAMQVSERTFKKFLHDQEDARRAWDDGALNSKVSLRRKQFLLAEKSHPMAIFLGKNMLGQRDEQHKTVNNTVTVTDMTESQLLEVAGLGSSTTLKSTKPKAVH